MYRCGRLPQVSPQLRTISGAYLPIRCKCKIFLKEYLLLLSGKQIGLMVSEIGTLSLSRNSAISLSKLLSVNLLAMARSANRVSGLMVSLQRLCSPKVTFIINHINLKYKKKVSYSRFSAYFYSIRGKTRWSRCSSDGNAKCFSHHTLRWEMNKWEFRRTGLPIKLTSAVRRRAKHGRLLEPSLQYLTRLKYERIILFLG